MAAPIGDGKTAGGRALRSDDRHRHDGVDVDPTHQPGPVLDIDPATMKPKVRRLVTAEEKSAKLASQGALTWEEQSEQVRRLNSILLARITAVIEDNRESDHDVHGILLKLSDIAKKWTTEKRAGGDDPTKLSTEEIERRLGK